MLPPNDRLARAAAEHQLARAETRVEAAVITAMRAWLAATRAAILTEAANLTVTAAGWPTPLAVDAAVSAYGVWRHELQATILPTVAIVMGEAFQAQRRANPDGAFWHQQQYLATVADRLRIWPENAFDDLRPELLELLADADTIDDATDRIGRVLNIDADTRDLRARISEVDHLLDTPDLDPAREAELRARRRALWNAHDQSLNEWRWKARRIARTEAHGAVQYGQFAAALHEEAVTGEVLYKRWLATPDLRTRAGHVVADGQIVRLRDKFRVDGFLLDFPGDPITIAPHTTINCRCSCVYLDSRAVQRELQGPKGSLGEVKPGGRRLGPDDPDAARAAVEKVAAERKQAPPKDQRGEQHGQTVPVVAPAVEPDPLPDPIPDIPDDLTGLSEDDLIGLMVVANSRGDDALFERVNAEFDRRAGLDDEDDAGGVSLVKVDAVRSERVDAESEQRAGVQLLTDSDDDGREDVRPRAETQDGQTDPVPTPATEPGSTGNEPPTGNTPGGPTAFGDDDEPDLGSAPTVRDVADAITANPRDRTPEEQLARALSGRYGPYRVQWRSAGERIRYGRRSTERFSRSVILHGDILDATGTMIGEVRREFRWDHDYLVVDNHLLKLDDVHQRKGFGGAFYRAMNAYYRRSGVDVITVEASLGNGGYTWASRGEFGWDPERVEGSFNNVRYFLDQMLDGTRLAPTKEDGELGDPYVVSDADKAILRAIRDRLDPARPDVWPTPKELATLSGDDPELGRKLMVGTTWFGLNALTEQGKYYRSTDGEPLISSAAMSELRDLKDQLAHENWLHGQEMGRLFDQVWAHHPESGMEEGLSDAMERELREVRAPEEARYAKIKADLLAKIEAARAAEAE